MEEEARIHRAMDMLLAILKLRAVDEARRRGVGEDLCQRNRDGPLCSGVEICPVPATHALGWSLQG